ncbi:MAG: MucB/RseB C-terminal domain-containing protein [Methylococcaceae bacterium]|nr:MucB/RseB C-terminal domain-containing protein [Methylococcaceae bacterium]MCI0733639.1 MucB/RseB C-terminal domain-containing protein [Methylococcaceae bacterium]
MNRIQTGHYYRLLFLMLGIVQTFEVFSNQDSGQSARQLLMEMSEAVKNRNYHGTVVYLREKKAETMRVFHALTNGVEKERIVAVNSPMREVIRSDQEVTCYLPDARLIYVSRQGARRSFLVRLPEDLESDPSYYEFLVDGREYVIQKEAQVIELRSKDQFRYGRKIWMDLDTRLPLKFEMIDEKGELVEQMMFTDLEVVDHLPAEALTVSSTMNTSDWEVRDGESLPDVKQTWTFDGIPQGFRQVFYRRTIMPTDKQAVEHILFSDGFSSVSVYVDKQGNDNVASYQKQWGAINSYSRLLDGYQITVLGAVPAKTVQAIGDGIEYLDETEK